MLRPHNLKRVIFFWTFSLSILNGTCITSKAPTKAATSQPYFRKTVIALNTDLLVFEIPVFSSLFYV